MELASFRTTSRETLIPFLRGLLGALLMNTRRGISWRVSYGQTYARRTEFIVRTVVTRWPAGGQKCPAGVCPRPLRSLWGRRHWGSLFAIAAAWRTRRGSRECRGGHSAALQASSSWRDGHSRRCSADHGADRFPHRSPNERPRDWQDSAGGPRRSGPSSIRRLPRRTSLLPAGPRPDRCQTRSG